MKMHTLSASGQHSSRVLSTSRMACCTSRSCPRYALAGSRSHLRRGSWLRRLCPPLCVAPSRPPSSSRGPSRTSMLIASTSAPTDRSTGIICDQTISLDGFWRRDTRQEPDPELLRRIRFKDPESGKTLVFITNNFSLPAATICALYPAAAQVGTPLQVERRPPSSDQAAHVGARGEDDSWIDRLGLRPRRTLGERRVVDPCREQPCYARAVRPLPRRPEIPEQPVSSAVSYVRSQITNQLNLRDC